MLRFWLCCDVPRCPSPLTLVSILGCFAAAWVTCDVAVESAHFLLANRVSCGRESVPAAPFFRERGRTFFAWRLRKLWDFKILCAFSTSTTCSEINKRSSKLQYRDCDNSFKVSFALHCTDSSSLCERTFAHHLVVCLIGLKHLINSYIFSCKLNIWFCTCLFFFFFFPSH